MMARVSVDRLARVLSLLEADLEGAPESERREAVREVAGCAIAAAADQRSYYEDVAARFPLEEYMRPDEVAGRAAPSAPSSPAPPSAASGVSGETIQAFTDALGVPAEAIEEERLLELAANWMQFTLAVDAAVRTIWREISKHVPSAEMASVPAPAAIRTVSAGFLSGSGAGSEEVRRHLDLLRRLISGMLMGLADAAKQHAQGQVRIFSPEAIRSSVPGKRNASREAAYWKQYETLVESHHAADVQAVFGAIQRRLAEYVIETLNASAGSGSRG